jgi:hypothetical protein
MNRDGCQRSFGVLRNSGQSMRIGIAYELREDYARKGYDEEETAEFNCIETIAAIELALSSLGTRRSHRSRARSHPSPGVNATNAASATATQIALDVWMGLGTRGHRQIRVSIHQRSAEKQLFGCQPSPSKECRPRY